MPRQRGIRCWGTASKLWGPTGGILGRRYHAPPASTPHWGQSCAGCGSLFHLPKKKSQLGPSPPASEGKCQEAGARLTSHLEKQEWNKLGAHALSGEGTGRVVPSASSKNGLNTHVAPGLGLTQAGFRPVFQYWCPTPAHWHSWA